MKRVDFIKKVAFAGATLPLIVSVGCSSSDGDDTSAADEPSCTEFGTESSIGGNHGHTINVSSNDVSNGVDLTYGIRGESEHSHTVTISAEQFAQLQNGESISVSSSTDEGHSHFINVRCANT